MTPAIMTNLDEPSSRKSGGGLMKKKTLHSNNLNSNPKLPKKMKKKQGLTVMERRDEGFLEAQTSNDAHSFSRAPLNSNGVADGFNCGSKVTYDISSYSRIQLIDLKRKLIAELEQIQSLKGRINANQPSVKEKNGSGKKRPLQNSTRPSSVIPACRVNSKDMNDAMLLCRRFLTTLLKQKRSWVFKKPVDAVALGLSDYHQIVKQPMDLGTVKSKLYNSYYNTPMDFAADVRLTFKNAILYNPRTDDVHRWAVELLDRFEELFKPVERMFTRQFVTEKQPQLQQDSWNRIPTPEIDRPNKPRLNGNGNGNDNPEIEIPLAAAAAAAAASSQNHGTVSPPSSRPTMKQQKPNKREMNIEEKQNLGAELESLPPEMMSQLVHIMKKRNQHLVQEGDEIELDFSSLDTETLWELHQFVTSYKRDTSNTRRQELKGNISNQDDIHASLDSSLAEDNKNHIVKKAKECEVGEEDVDIGDEDMPECLFPPLEIAKDEGSSSSTSSSSSSSGDSEDSRRSSSNSAEISIGT